MFWPLLAVLWLCSRPATEPPWHSSKTGALEPDPARVEAALLRAELRANEHEGLRLAGDDEELRELVRSFYSDAALENCTTMKSTLRRVAERLREAPSHREIGVSLERSYSVTCFDDETN